MIPTTSDNHDLTGSLGGTTVKMSVDLSNLTHIMNVLTDLYSDSELAILREYSTNAMDSHAMAGVTRPIEVILPTPLRQSLEIRDFGLGLSVDEISEIYGTYGASTKRETNDATGCLGLGSKSALTYTNMFTVQGIKNGVLAEVAIYRDATGAGSMEIVDTKATDEPNGVKVTIPIASGNSIAEKAERFFRVWTPGTVLVNGEQPVSVFDNDKAFWLNKSTLIVPGDNHGKYVVMGNVPYPAGDAGYWHKFGVYYFAEMGEVGFTPSRESLDDSDGSKQVRQWMNNYDQHLADFIRAKVDACKTDAEVVEVFQNYCMLMPNVRFYYQGHALMNSVDLSEGVRLYEPDTYNTKKISNKAQMWLSKLDQSVVLDLMGKPFTPTRREQYRLWREANMPDASLVYLTKRVSHPLFGTVKHISLTDLDKFKVTVPRAQGTTKVKAEYDVWDAGSGYSTYKIIPSGKTVVYGDRKFANLAADADDKYVFVKVTARREAKFLRENPKAMPVSKYSELVVKNLPDVTPIEHERIRFGWGDEWITNNADRFLDPEFKALAKVDHADALKRYRKREQFGAKMSERAGTLKRYPLLNRGHMDASIEYANMLYTERNK